MNHMIIVLRVMALTVLILILNGCSSSSNNDDNLVRDETLYEVRIGSNSIGTETVPIIPFLEENKLRFQFLKYFKEIELIDTLAARILIENKTKNIGIELSDGEILNRGSFLISNNDYGSVVTYSSKTPFGTDLVIEDGEAYLSYGEVIYPGDKIDITVKFLSAKFDDGKTFFTSGDKFSTYCVRSHFARSSDDIDTDGLIESIHIGKVKITDQDINIVPFGEVLDVSLDFGVQLNPISFLDDFNFRFVVNNVTNGISFVLDKNKLTNNGRLVIKDSVKGEVAFLLDRPNGFFLLGEEVHSLFENPIASPGDVLNINIDIIEGKDILGNKFRVQNKRFQIFYAGSPGDYVPFKYF